MPNIDIEDREAVLSDIAEALDVDEDVLSQLTAPVPLRYDKKVFEPPDLKILATKHGDTYFWIFEALEDAQEANNAYAQWLIEEGLTELTSQAEFLAHAIDPSLLSKFVFSVAHDSEEVEKLAYVKGPPAFWKAAASLGLFPDAEEDTKLDWVPDKYVKQFRKAYGKKAAETPLQFLLDSVGKDETIDLLLNSVGVFGDSAERLAQFIVKEDTLSPLNVANRIGLTRHGLVFLQTAGKPVSWPDLEEIPQPI